MQNEVNQTQPARASVDVGRDTAQAGPKERVVVAMSGGVDSSVAAHLLQAAGHDLVGLFMRNGVKVGADEAPKKSCCSVSDARDARMVAGRLGIPFQAVDLSEEFTQLIIAQRGFQANSRIITVSDEMIQELVNLKR